MTGVSVRMFMSTACGDVFRSYFHHKSYLTTQKWGFHIEFFIENVHTFRVLFTSETQTYDN